MAIAWRRSAVFRMFVAFQTRGQNQGQNQGPTQGQTLGSVPIRITKLQRRRLQPRTGSQAEDHHYQPMIVLTAREASRILPQHKGGVLQPPGLFRQGFALMVQGTK